MRTSTIMMCLSMWCLVGCEEPFSDESTILALRILGIRAEPVWLTPEAPVVLEAMWAAPKEESDFLEAVWFICDNYAMPTYPGWEMCSLVVSPEVASVTDSVVRREIDVPGIVEGMSPEEYPLGVMAFLLLCNGTIQGLPDVGEKVNTEHLSVFCDGTAQAIAQRWIDTAIPDETPPVNPRFELVTVNGEPLPDGVVTETTVECTGGGCPETVPISVTLDPIVYDAFPDAEAPPVSVRWYTTTGEMMPLQSVSFEPETLSTQLIPDGAGRHDVYLVVRGAVDALSFMQITVHLLHR